jgi:hypothetical protein
VTRITKILTSGMDQFSGGRSADEAFEYEYNQTFVEAERYANSDAYIRQEVAR